ncbi:MAG TPA: glycosyltransferase [Lutibacter sp.]
MYILIVSRGYPTPKNILSGIFEFDQAKALHSIGHKVVFAVIDFRSLRRYRKLGFSYLVKDGIKIYSLSIPLGRIPSWLMLFIGKIGLSYLYKRIEKNEGRPDVVHAHFTIIGAFTSILKNKFHLPIILTEHSSLINKAKLKKSTSFFGRKAFNSCDKIISVSSALSKRIYQHFGKESHIIPNIVDTKVFKYNNKILKRDFRFISVGNLIEGKGHGLLIDAFINSKFNKNIYLDIIGNGPLHKHMQIKIDKANVSNQIKLLGRLSRSETAKIMQQSDIFVLASETETFGVVYIEALACGLPVIATLCGGPEDFINKDNGIFIPIKNIVALKEALLYMYSNNHIYNNKEISSKCKKKFNSETIALKLTHLYETIL